MDLYQILADEFKVPRQTVKLALLEFLYSMRMGQLRRPKPLEIPSLEQVKIMEEELLSDCREYLKAGFACLTKEKYPLTNSIIQLRFKLGRVKKITVERNVFYELEREYATAKYESPGDIYVGEFNHNLRTIQICGIIVEMEQ